MSGRVIIVGSGVTGLVAAIAARQAGLEAVVLEKTDKWGGTSAMSGGSLWIPGHHLMADNNMPDNLEVARAYMDSHIAQAGPAASEERRSAFIATGPKMVRALADLGFEWEFSPFPDYYPQQEGATLGRGVNARLFDGAELGPWLKSMRQMNRIPSVVALPHEFGSLLKPFRDIGTLKDSIKVALRTAWWRLRGKSPMFIGQALTARMLQLALKLGVEVRLDSPVVDLVSENERVVGVIVAKPGGAREEVRGDAGVIIGAGGFARNGELRRKYQPVGSDWTVVNPADTGDALVAALKLGAATGLMDDAWWGISTVFPDGERSFLLWERALPHSIIVDQTGQRFTNEAGPYNDAGRALVERMKTHPADPSWLIMDARHRSTYVFANLLPGYNPGWALRSGFLTKAASLDELARKCGIDAAGLKATVARFNGFARSGKDEDFHRGESLFDNVYGDDAVKPNPNLGAIERAPFWAVKVHPSDLGTKGGLLTDENGQVIDTDGKPIAGLYAAGNTTASVMGRGYPGPGSTLGPAAVFAWRAAMHAAGKQA